jgi:hypothetical protein
MDEESPPIVDLVMKDRCINIVSFYGARLSWLWLCHCLLAFKGWHENKINVAHLIEIIKEQFGFLFGNLLTVDFNINVMMIISLNFNTLYQF